MCVYWDKAAEAWSSEGCSLVVAESTEQTAVCHCPAHTGYYTMFPKIKQCQSIVDDVHSVMQVFEHYILYAVVALARHSQNKKSNWRNIWIRDVFYYRIPAPSKTRLESSIKSLNHI